MIALLTDFGSDDPYVGIMKGVILDLTPGSELIDITHHIPPGDIQRGAFVLWQAAQDFSKGTIFLCVVDPGVGSERKGILLQTGGLTFVGPDNGLFSYVLYKSQFKCWELSNAHFQRDTSSATFHGRDIFAPAAAYAARSVPGKEFGVEISKLVSLSKPNLIFREEALTGEVLSQDHFGNLFTSIGRFKYQKESIIIQSWIDNTERSIADITTIRIKVKDQLLPLVKTFESIAPGKCAGVIGSTGLLEIVANQASAKSLLGLENGCTVSLSWD